MVENLKHYFVSNHHDGSCKISIDIFEKSLLAHFPQKTSIEIANLMNCVQSFGACTVAGKDVDISCLFDDRDGVYSPFVQLLWLQGLHERTTFLRLLQVSNVRKTSCTLIAVGFIYVSGCCVQDRTNGCIEGHFYSFSWLLFSHVNLGQMSSHSQCVPLN